MQTQSPPISALVAANPISPHISPRRCKPSNLPPQPSPLQTADIEDHPEYPANKDTARSFVEDLRDHHALSPGVAELLVALLPVPAEELVDSFGEIGRSFSLGGWLEGEMAMRLRRGPTTGFFQTRS